MRSKGLLYYVGSLALAMSVGLACSTKVERSGYGDGEKPDAGDDTDFGSKEKKDPDAGKGCSSTNTEIKRIPVVIEFVVDASGSMDSDNKWTSARDALKAAFEEMEKNQDPATFVGLMRYSTNVGKKVAPAALVSKIPKQPSKQYDELVSTIDTSGSDNGSTATGAALEAAYAVVEKFKPLSMKGLVPGQMNRVVVLLSDGVPDGAEPGKAACETLVGEKFDEAPPLGPILTFSVGIGSFSDTAYGYDPQFMGRLAQRGGTAPTDCALDATDPTATCHFQVTPGQDPADTKQALIDAFNRIRALSASCEFSFEKNDNTDLENVTVEITDGAGNKVEIEQDPDNGWTFDDENNPTKVVLHGDACSASSGAVSGRVDVTIGCSSAN